MHFVPYRCKRAHYALLKMMWPIAEKSGLTPARFDLLYAAHTLRRRRYQANIARMLGVSRTTVWRMVHALVEAGFVESVLDCSDWRRRRVMLTRWGRRRFNRLLKIAVRRHKVENEIRTAIRPSLGLRRRSNVDEHLALDKISSETARVTFGFNDGGRLDYPHFTDLFDDR